MYGFFRDFCFCFCFQFFNFPQNSNQTFIIIVGINKALRSAYTRNKNVTEFLQLIPCVNGMRFLRKKESKTTTASHRQKNAGKKNIKIPEKTENMKEISQVVSQK